MALAETAYEAMEGFESESEAAERAPFRRPSPASSFRPRPAPGALQQPVTQPQLEAALTRVDAKIKTVSDSSAAINARVAALQTASKKEADERKKSVDTQSRDLNQKVQLLALLPLLLKSPTAQGPLTIDAGTGNLVDASKNPISAVSVPSAGGLDAVLPLLLVGGLGGTGGGFGLGGDSGSGSDNSMVLLALVLAFARP
jgi:hypothetical protein